jgi:hypothetical protein
MEDKMKNKLIRLIFLGLLLIPASGYGQAISDYLILQDIGSYKLGMPEKMFAGEPPSGGPQVRDGAGVLSASGHFRDHADKTYEVMYLGGGTYASPTVKITQHAGGDSDRWLLHEIEDIYRDTDDSRFGLLLRGAIIRKIGVDRVFSHGIGGGGYTWLSNNNVVVNISYTSLVAGTPKPTEVVQAYLAKFPSTMPATLVLDNAHNVAWIKDEMDRRLWLCDKWLAQILPSDPKLTKKLKTIVDNIIIFLEYRKKYFGVATSDAEWNLLVSYVNQKDSANIQAKLTEYKTWWNEHKNDSITVQEKKVQSTEYKVQ